MHSQRTSAPKSLESLREGQRIPSDEVDDLINDLRHGDTSQIVGGEEMEENWDPGHDSPNPERRTPSVPEVVTRVLDSSARDELIELAKFLDPSTRKKLTLVFHTPIGEVKTAVEWTSNKPDDLMKSDRLMLVKVRSNESMFAPKPGAELEIGFDEYPGKVKVTCLAPPQRLYPGVDLLCFLPHNALMEKNGRLKEGAPSVVSGAPSTGVDEAGEPVADHEKSAAAKLATAPSLVLEEEEPESFDKPREA